MKKFALFFLIVLLLPFYLLANEITIAGFVLTEKTKESIPFATIKLKESSTGVISNENGSFKLQIKQSLINDQTLLISCIGFETFEMPLNKIKHDEINYFYLKDQIFTLDEITVQSKKFKLPPARATVEKAIKNIANNYANEPFLLEGYYRDYIKVNQTYKNLFESTIQLEDLGIEECDIETSKIKKLYGSINSEFDYDPRLIVPYNFHQMKTIPSGDMRYKGNNELAILRISDPIRNYQYESFDFINCLQTNFLKNHDFYKITDVVYEQQTPIFVIPFDHEEQYLLQENIGPFKESKKQHKTIIAKGKIYIEYGSYLIKKLHYEVFIDEPKHGYIKVWELNLEYDKHNQKAYLKYLSFNNIIDIPNYNDSAYFYLKNINIINNRNTIALEFNNKLDAKTEKKIKRMKVFYLNKRLKYSFEKIEDNMIYLKIKKGIFGDQLKNYRKSGYSPFQIDFPTTLSDIYKNKIDRAQKILAYQYREFFVNRIYKNYVPLEPEECISKWQSLIEQTKEKTDKKIVFNSPLLK